MWTFALTFFSMGKSLLDSQTLAALGSLKLAQSSLEVKIKTRRVHG